jgi:hypothetical protein
VGDMERIILNCLVGINVGYCYDYVAAGHSRLRLFPMREGGEQFDSIIGIC